MTTKPTPHPPSPERTAMSPEAQGVAIAKVCGWTESKHGWWSHPTLPCNGGAEPCPPDYLNDLNACHEIEKVLTPPQSERYAELLLDVLEIPSPFIGTARCAYLTNHATAAQRCEAFLKTLNLWKPTP